MNRAAARTITARPDPAAVLTKALLRAAERLALRQRDLAAILGSSEASVSRLNQERTLEPTSKEGELALLFLRAYRSLDTLVGGDELAAREWVHASNTHLRGIPAERMRTVEGLVDVVRYLDAVRGTL
ncbi:MAG: MbcA/ParS/Xre antitoxin family protein [Gemmatimonas sp.]